MKWTRKDRDPKETIEIITKILNKIGLDYTIKSEHNSAMWSSLNLEINQLPGIFTNGKGISHDYALASALGEMMERLQCGLLIDEDFFVNKKNKLEDPEPAEVDLSAFHNYIGNIFENYTPLEVQSFLYRNPKYGILGQYTNLIDGKSYNLPCELIHYICGSNGTCAGNSRDEALCQGISEIFERYILKKIFFDDIFLKNIRNIDYGLVYGYSKQALDFITSKGYKVSIKDLSCGNSVPVLGLLVFNNSETKYAFSIGSDIEFDICLQRCITEMFQGEDFNFSFRYKMKEVWCSNSCKSIAWSARERSHEYTRALINKSGYMPISFLLSKTSCSCIPSIFTTKKDNKGSLEYNLTICKRNGWSVFIKDYSWLDFPAYRVYIPNISEAFYVPVDDWIKVIEDINVAKRTWSNLNLGNKELMRDFAMIIERIYSVERYRCNSVSVNKLLGIIIDTEDSQYNYLRNFDDLLFDLYCQTGDIHKAFESMDDNLVDIEKRKEILHLLKSDNGDIETEAQSKYYPNCPDCDTCGLRNICRYDNYIKIVNLIQDKGWGE